MIGSIFRRLAAGVALASLVGAAAADVLLIEKVRERMQLDLPGNGLSMNQVEQHFGTPAERRSPVGEPPITRWIYDDYSVFFEHDLVIESVVHHNAVIREVNDQSRN